MTDTVFRRLIARWGRPHVFVTEFTSADGMFSAGRDRVLPRLLYTEEERPLVAQLWGKDPEAMFRAAQEVKRRGFDGVDINMGCPVEKIVKKGCCSALIENPTLAREQILAAKEGAQDLPVSVKTRLGFRDRRTESWTTFLLETGIDVLTMHGRLAKDMSKYPADWDEIGRAVQIRDQLGCPTLIIGNGDVLNLEEVHQKHRMHGVDGVMIGRGIFQDPVLFHPDRSYNDVPLEEKLTMLRDHVSLYFDVWGPKRPFKIMKKFLKVYLQGFRGAHALRIEAMECEDVESLFHLLERWQQDPPTEANESTASLSTAQP
ncbi:MAG: tRNA-dihydrouridine synthase [Myxococcales bacterium]|nr:tRNA-dihydrouridine synthase [Myxococcales bacterium]